MTDPGTPIRIVCATEAPLAVGVVRTGGLSVLVRCSFVPGEDGALSLADAVPPVARDFVPRKGAADLLLSGHAFAEDPRARIDARVELGGVRRAFAVVAEAPAVRIPLADDAIRGPDGDEPVDPVGALPLPPTEVDVSGLEPEAWSQLFDGFEHNAAAREQRGDFFAADAAIELAGLSPRGPRRTLRLPGLEPRVLADLGDEQVEVKLVCDTLSIHTDDERVTTVWRGAIPGASGEGREIDLLLVALGTEERSWEAMMPDVPRWTFGFAAEPDSLDPRPASELEALLLDAARAVAMASSAPRASLSLDAYATLCAELAEGRQSRVAVLSGHGLDDTRWLCEEQAWLLALADDADGIARRYAEIYEAAEDRLAAADESRHGIELHARAMAALEAGVEEDVVMAALGLARPAWSRLDRRVRRELLADPARRDEHARQVALARGSARRREP